jgi:hypothetical protein
MTSSVYRTHRFVAGSKARALGRIWSHQRSRQRQEIIWYDQQEAWERGFVPQKRQTRSSLFDLILTGQDPERQSIWQRIVSLWNSMDMVSTLAESDRGTGWVSPQKTYTRRVITQAVRFIEIGGKLLNYLMHYPAHPTQAELSPWNPNPTDPFLKIPTHLSN